ncbi:MAG: terminase small subunit [Anaerolineae bacterium]|nr:terminase small subunit [Anaerolineae bacterium]
MPYSQACRDQAVEIAQQNNGAITEAVLAEIREAIDAPRLTAKTVRRWLADRSVLNDGQQAFVYYYLQTFNATKAAILAGYSPDTAYAQGHRLLKNAEIRAEIDRHMRTLAMDATEVLVRLSAHARGDFSEFIGLSPRELEDHPLSFLLKKYKHRSRTDKDGNTEDTYEVEIHDPQSALVQLGRYHKLFTDKHEHSGSIVTTARELTDEELLTIIHGNQ